jgi:type IX secretion system PorP/SprF family membrane protein
MKKIILIVAGLISGYCNTLSAQDVHFSQFFNTPAALNPALTGFMKADYRVNAIYRTQWRTVNAPFNTIALAGDMNFIPQKLNGDKVGAGIFVFNDQMGSEILNNNSAFASLSYIKTLDRQKRHKLALGTQFGFVQKSIEYNRFYTSQQVKDFKIDKSLASGESISSFSYFNMSVGGFYKFRLSPNTDVHLGYALFNVLRPKENFTESFADPYASKLKNRSIINIGGIQKISSKLYIHPEIMLMGQTKARDVNAGLALEYALTGNPDLIMLQAGAWVRKGDAVIFYGGIKYHNIHIGLSYDKTYSSLLDIRDSQEVKDNARIGAYEVTLTYTGFLKRAIPHEHTVPCRFF